MSSFDRLSHFKSIFGNFFAQAQLSKNTPNIDVLVSDQDKITIYGSNFQQVNLTPYGGESSTVYVLVIILVHHNMYVLSNIHFFYL